MNSPQDNQSDLEVIMDFLEEYYRQNRDNGWGNLDDVYWTTSVSVDDQSRDRHQHFTCCETLVSPSAPPVAPHGRGVNRFTCASQHACASICQNAAAAAPDLLPPPPATADGTSDPDPEQGIRAATRHSSAHTSPGTGRKTRLFHFLFEMLEDPAMAHCLSWVPAAAASGTGVFRFSSGNKDQVAALWGQRKGNKRPMTYQKMSRALRNYARSGEIFKVKKKLTYQFGPDTLQSLKQCRHDRH